MSQDLRYGYWHVIAYDDDGRVKYNSDKRDARRSLEEINEWCSAQALVLDWSAYVVTFIS